MQITTYVDLAVQLVNTAGRRGTPGRPSASSYPGRDDTLQTVADLRVLLADQAAWRRMITEDDLGPMRSLRGELRTVFEDGSIGEESAAVQRINVLLAGIQVAPRLTGHDGQAWHLHMAESATSAYGAYSAAVVLGVAFYVEEHGFHRLGVCQAQSCPRVFLDVSTNRSRRYCSDRCATRSNVAAFRARQRGQTGAQ